MIWISFVSFILSLILTYLFLPMVRNLLLNSQVVCENFELDEIPTAMGLVFIFVQIISLGSIKIIYGLNDNFILIYLLGFVIIGLIGLLDDLIGDKIIKGLKGHIISFLKGTLTTGGIKAFVGLFIAFFVSSYISPDLLGFIVNGLIIGLFTNCINLFDLRPGRATKVFAIISIIFIIFNLNSYNNYIIISFYGILIPYILLDLKSKVMMGDTGSNVLGYTLGVYCVTNFEITVKMIILILLILIHLLAEKISFTKVINNNKVLNYLDNLGR